MTSLLVIAGLWLAQIPLPPARTGTVTGVLRTATGEPAAGVRVAAMAVTDATAGIGEGALVSLTQTDGAGRYRLENIPPGRYYIQAGLVDFPTYYPGVTNTNGAKSVQITAGSELEGLDFPLGRGAGVRISGRVSLGMVRPRLVMLRPDPTGGTAGFRPQPSSQINADGSFEFLRVPPGSYSLSLSPNNGLPALPLVVTDKDIDVGVPTGPGVKVSGIVGLGPQSPRTLQQKVVLTGSSAWAQIEAPIDADGKFAFPSVPAGSYSIRTVPLGSASALAHLVVGEREVTGIVVPGVVELSGTVVFSDGTKLPRLSPALMLEAVSPGASMATAVRSDGEFRLPLVEGEYRISLGSLPAGISVMSIAYGSSDLLNLPLKLDGTEAAREVRVTIRKTR